MTDTKKAELKCPYIDPQCHSMGQEGACRHWMVDIADREPCLASGHTLNKYWKSWGTLSDASLKEHVETATQTGNPWKGLKTEQKKIIKKTKPTFEQKIPAKYLKNRACYSSAVFATKTLAEIMAMKPGNWDRIYSMDPRHNIVQVFDQENPDQTQLSQDLHRGYTICTTGNVDGEPVDYYYSILGLPKGHVLSTTIINPY
jgi:hypothetical protein